MTPEGKKVAINIMTDTAVYSAPQNPPTTGNHYTSGNDLYAHKARSGRVYFYTYFWSMWHGTESQYDLLTEDEARQFLLQKAQGSGHEVLSRGEVEQAEEYFPGIFDENA